MAEQRFTIIDDGRLCQAPAVTGGRVRLARYEQRHPGAAEGQFVRAGQLAPHDLIRPTPSRRVRTAAYVYLLRCGDGSFYAGWTTDLAARVARHQAGNGGRYTRGRVPVELVYVEALPDRRQARRREWALRRLSHRRKAWLAALGVGGPGPGAARVTRSRPA